MLPLKVLLTIFGVFIAKSYCAEKDPSDGSTDESEIVVETTQGKLRGRFQSYQSGHSGGYFAFQGIRYGQPPVGNRRFRSAVSERPWYGVRDALSEGNDCPHKNSEMDTYEGNEDCLFLNVYTTQLANDDGNPKLPVMVWLHGGEFAFGSGNAFIYGPDFLVAEDVILVTLNYRLGPLGFLAAGPDAPGNAGLKDQVLALKWVRDNIEAFGGDSNSVTVFGESAGAASVHYLLLSPLASGLFNRAISESGTAQTPWSMAYNASGRALRLAELLGYTGGDSASNIIAYLRQMPALKLIEAAPLTLNENDFLNKLWLPFLPTIEGFWNDNSEDNDTFLEDPLITEHPEVLYHKGRFNNVPYIVGYNTHEAMPFVGILMQDPNLLEIIDRDFVRLVPSDLNVSSSEEAFLVSDQIREFYLGSLPVGPESVDQMIYLLTDLMFLQGIVKSARSHATFGTAPVYFYRFAFDGELNLFKQIVGISRPGVCHADELGYLFKNGVFNFTLDPLSVANLVKNRMVKMWTNFAKYGNPTPPNSNSVLLSTWKPIDKANALVDLQYLDISSTLQMGSNPESERLSFWDKLYIHYNGHVI